MKPRKLTKKQFDQALKNGLGAALLHVKKYGDRGLEKELLQACLTSYVYDRQTCQSRGYWLAKILDHTNAIEHYAAAVKTALLQAPNRGKDFDQLVVLATELFERGFDEFKGVLLELQPENSYQGSAVMLGESLIDVASFSGFDAAARKMVLVKTKKREKAALFEYFSEELLDSEKKAVAYLNEKVQTDLVLSEFWTEVQSHLADDEHRKPFDPASRPIITIDQIIVPADEIVHFERFANRYRRFGKAATDEELRSVLEEFNRETEKRRLYNYLAVFWDRELPVVPRKVFDLLKSNDKDLRLAARNALSLVKSPAIRKLALQALKESFDDDRMVIGAWLLKRNFRLTDASLLLQTLRKIKDIDSQHWAACRVIEIAETIDNRKLTDLVIFVFETTPCDHCRSEALQKLVDWNTASEQLLFEAQWDVSYLVKRIARDKANICT